MPSTTSMTTTALFALYLTTETCKVSAYVPTAGRAPRNMPPSNFKNRGATAPTSEVLPAADTESMAAPWRIALNIGDKPGYFSSTSWPIITKCDFGSNQEIIPQQGDVRYTTRTGQVVKPIEKGKWSLENNRKLSFDLSFPELMSRNELTIKAGTTITCEGILYTLSDLKVLNDNFYQARDKTWELGGELNDLDNERDGPKKWNDDKQQWERSNGFDAWAYAKKRLQHAQLQNKQEQENSKRPEPKTLSAYSGDFPGIQNKDQVFIGKMGIIKQGTQVIGTWAAEPIFADRPVSYTQ
eukprot:CAMPEP_0119019224 /NCGR_PEP_ID=MMETSP1176-20130426/21280_1 /TAXON_ID=265551 /ORGANISM="Synedropsis recta cf, Strain CCMP1620" /LENGTH=296 /DNA_ID=CAMNT_0006973375 /DNA_START=65 /DNA_END=955 /DNA_ORIENTATION=+